MCFRSVMSCAARSTVAVIALARDSTSLEEERAPTCGRELSLDFERLELVTSGHQRGQGGPEAGRFPIGGAKVTERHALRLLARDAERRVKRPVAGLHTKLIIQDDQRGGDGIENRLRVLAFVNGLLNTGPKRGDIREREDRPRRLPTGRRIGSRAKQEAPIATPDVTAAWRVIRDDLPTELLNILDVPQSGDGIESAALCRSTRERMPPSPPD